MSPRVECSGGLTFFIQATTSPPGIIIAAEQNTGGNTYWISPEEARNLAKTLLEAAEETEMAE